jgi:hypothetical protein
VTPAVELQVRVPLRRLAYLLHAAYDGCAYWAQIVGYEDPPDGSSIVSAGSGDAVNYPLTGGAVLISNAPAEAPGEVTIARLDLAAIARGLRLMYDTQPRHYCDFIGGNEDAITGDVFLQLCLYGEVVYG